ncbi:MAG: murein DD-endopeptidase MepM/ murein hydrolase activator NlpD [Verrucomicrobiales bacterium]|jgi:murein DD-endopeptidase MepM/ murein hydrolase activator NlpD
MVRGLAGLIAMVVAAEAQEEGKAPFQNPIQSNDASSQVEFGGNFSEDLSDVFLDSVFPLYTFDGDRRGIFGHLHVNSRDDDSHHGSFGLGYRQIVEELDSVLGFRAHLDLSETAIDQNNFTQFGLGMDVFHGSGIDLHLNWYLGTSEREDAGSFSVPSAGAIFNYQTFEQAMDSGGDLRLELPLTFRDQPTGLELMVGAYAYDMPYSGDLSGVMAGVEYRPIDLLTAGITWYQDEEVFGGNSNWVASLSASVPLDFGKTIKREGGLIAAFRSLSQEPATAPSLQERFYSERTPRLGRILTEVSEPELVSIEVPISRTRAGTVYPIQANSLYILPWSVGSSYNIGQGNRGDSNSGSQKFAYDFDMPNGSTIRAARAGVVIEVEESFSNGTGVSGEENFIVIRHSDRTVTGYYHLNRNGARVRVGDRVSQGQRIAKSGNSGDSSQPHLHFEVLQRRDGNTRPITFRNTRPHSNGLVESQRYRAGPFQAE